MDSSLKGLVSPSYTTAQLKSNKVFDRKQPSRDQRQNFYLLQTMLLLPLVLMLKLIVILIFVLLFISTLSVLLAPALALCQITNLGNCTGRCTVQDLYSFHLFQMLLHCWMMIILFTMLDKQLTDACFISPKHFFSSTTSNTAIWSLFLKPSRMCEY